MHTSFQDYGLITHIRHLESTLQYIAYTTLLYDNKVQSPANGEMLKKNDVIFQDSAVIGRCKRRSSPP